MGVALMLSTPNAPFMVKYADRMQDEFTPDCYACHSTVLAKSLAVEYPEEIQVRV